MCNFLQLIIVNTLKTANVALARGLAGWNVTNTPKGCGFDPQEGYVWEATN